MSIDISIIKKLRDQTGAGVSACSNALKNTGGDIEKAIEFMRKAGQAQAAKKAGRITAEGLIMIAVSDNAKKGVILEVNCETDFVAREESFQQFVSQLARLLLEFNQQDEKAIADLAYTPHQTVDQARQELIHRTGENIQIRRAQWMETEHQLGFYTHMGRRGCLVTLAGGDSQLAKDIAIHIVGSNPIVIKPESIAPELIAKEREIANAQTQTIDKPPEVIQKIIENRINKFRNESSLLGQAFIKDSKITVAQHLSRAKAEVISFTHFILGEGIEKKSEDFAKEIQRQVENANAN